MLLWTFSYLYVAHPPNPVATLKGLQITTSNNRADFELPYHDSAQRDETATIPSRDVAGLALLLTNPYLRERRCGLKLLVRARDFVSTPLVQV